MSVLPEGWTAATLHELFVHQSGNSKVIKGRQSAEPRPGLFPAYSASGLDIWTVDAEHQGRGLVVSAVGARCGKVFRASAPAWTAAANTHVLKPISADVNVDYWWYLVNDENWWIRSGSAQPFVKVKDSMDRLVPLPPLAEQLRIVEAIEKAFSNLEAGEAGLRNARRLLGRMRESVLAVALTGRLLDQDQSDTPARMLLAGLQVEPLGADSGLPELPSSWAWASLGSVADITGGVTKDSKRQDDPGLVEVPYLRVANVQRGFLDLNQVTTIRVAPSRAEQLALEPGDVLFNEGGDRDKLGRGWVWSGEVPGCIHQNHVFRARLSAGFEPRLVSWWGNTFGRKWFERHGKQTTNLASLNLTTLKSFPIPVAPPEEQRRIAAEVERQMSFIDGCERAVDAGLARSMALRRSVLKVAFEGLLVSQDPMDEPAPVLLERIRSQQAERGTSSDARRGRKVEAS